MRVPATACSRRAAVAVAVSLAAVACGSSGGPSKAAPGFGDRSVPKELAADQTLRAFSFSKPMSFDPARQGQETFAGNALRRQYAEALLKPQAGVLKAADLNVSGAAAESWSVSGDGLTYTFKLRKNAKFNDGQPVRAQDFVYGWRRLIDPRTASPSEGAFARSVKGGMEAAALGPGTDAATVEAALDRLGLRAVDDQTFEVTLGQPGPYFKWVAILTAGAPIRRDVVERFGADQWANKPETLVTNGPFKVADVGQTQTTMVANPFYWDKVGLKRFVAGYGLDPTPRWTQYLNDQLDVSNGPGSESYKQALDDPRFKGQIIQYPELSIQWMQFNTAKAPFDKSAVREAFTKAIDRNAYNQVAADTGQPFDTLVPQGMPGYNPGLGGIQAYDVNQAKSLLQSSGISTDQLGGLHILTGSAQESNALFIKDQLQKNLGVNVTVDSIGDSATVNSRTKKGDYNMLTTFIGHAANYPDPQDFFDVFLSTSPGNTSGWKNPDYDRLVTEADTSTDASKRSGLYDQAHRLLLEQAPVAFLVQLQRIFWVKPWVRAITRTPVDAAYMPGDLYSKDIVIAKH
ncbi:MAG: hypothetical protein DLM65_00100 [Candidatus Aeolococcus gillhamiae]|uniref:Solute-binding protein family 5 domain-containing protein n=1 Tax=Candidatus Aeolococcus gillhamiae TaxID=3127015 RepID=A0A2W5ZFS7_9BACT|nr:MAG: hypothetical protein DLM65_00100 [Candidatus Dormibacter sp. RRmetagenome_bin12]